MRISDWSSDVGSSDLLVRNLEKQTSGPKTLRSKSLGRRYAALDSGLDQPLHFLLQLRALAVAAGRNLGGNQTILAGLAVDRSEERRVGKECVGPCRSRWSRYH